MAKAGAETITEGEGAQHKVDPHSLSPLDNKDRAKPR